MTSEPHASHAALTEGLERCKRNAESLLSTLTGSTLLLSDAKVIEFTRVLTSADVALSELVSFLRQIAVKK